MKHESVKIIHTVKALKEIYKYECTVISVFESTEGGTQEIKIV